jgi:flagella basal body P-ring formation protein FlgA
VPVWFKVEIKAAALLARENHQSGQVVSIADFSRQEVFVEDVDKLELLEDQQRQWVARKTIHAGQVLQRGDIGGMPDVNKGDAVDALVESNGIRLTVRATALESGFAGNVIRVMPVNGQNALYAKVAGKNAVRVE